MHTEYLDYKNDDVTGEAFVAYDESTQGKRPCILVAHAWAGQGDYERMRAQQLAELGYVAFAIDNYGKGVRGEPLGDNSHLMQPLMADRAKLRRRLLAAYEAAQKHPKVDPERMGAIGYCFGGLCVLDLARSTPANLKGVVSFHGLLLPPQLGPQPPITAKVLILHGYDDPMVPPEQVIAAAKELTEAKADWQIHAYGHTMHAFTAPVANAPERGLKHNPAAERRSWIAMKNFFEEVFSA